jgi:hypothetical protein
LARALTEGPSSCASLKSAATRDLGEGIARRDPPRHGRPRRRAAAVRPRQGSIAQTDSRGTAATVSIHPRLGGGSPLSWGRKGKGREMKKLGEEEMRDPHLYRAHLPKRAAAAAVRPPPRPSA